MKVKDLEEIPCAECPIRINGHCHGEGYETCTALDPETDVDQYLETCDKAIKEYENQKVRRGRRSL